MNEIHLIEKQLQKVNSLPITSLDQTQTALIVVDMVNGFAKGGNLYSDRVESIINPIVTTTKLFRGFTKLFVADRHTSDSVEFNAYLPHCIGDESQVIEELKELYDEFTVEIPKNSTNAFLSPFFQNWFESNKDQYNQYVIIGDCTDICILQLALSLKAYYNEENKRSRIIVPTNAVETYHLDLNNHYGDLMNVFALYNMALNGIELVKNIE
jgi:nicotinamidase-related amidase